jgi:hypothetical protein
LPTTELLNAKLKSREKVEKYTAVITGDFIKHEEKWSILDFRTLPNVMHNRICSNLTKTTQIRIFDSNFSQKSICG